MKDSRFKIQDSIKTAQGKISLKLILILVGILVLAGVAIFTAIRLTAKKPIIPTVPRAITEACTASFTVAEAPTATPTPTVPGAPTATPTPTVAYTPIPTNTPVPLPATDTPAPGAPTNTPVPIGAQAQASPTPAQLPVAGSLTTTLGVILGGLLLIGLAIVFAL